MQIYLVGGAVRDQLLGLEPVERDWVVVDATPEQMTNQGYRQVGKDFPVFLHPETREEYALARTERKQGHGYKGFEFDCSTDVSLEDDLLRRDLTINAIAQNQQGDIIDPYNGKADLEARVLRHVSDAFIEDPLRVLRVARFAARFAHLDFSIADETLELMRSIAASGELDYLTPERIWLETTKALNTRTPTVFFETLRSCDALQVIFPEVNALFGVPQRADYHPEIDTGVHTMMVLEQAAKLSADAEVRFAALVHDLGKAETSEDILPSHHGHEKKTVRLINQMAKRLRIPKQYRDIAVLVGQYHTHVHRVFELKPGTMLDMFERIDIFRKPERLHPFLLACKADSLGRKGFEQHDYPQADFVEKCAVSLQQINTRRISEQFDDGKQIADAIRRERLQVLARMRGDRYVEQNSDKQHQQNGTEQ
jgi:tRNA nucleotidyltransferase (CCA-adding enzyme)